MIYNPALDINRGIQWQKNAFSNSLQGATRIVPGGMETLHGIGDNLYINYQPDLHPSMLHPLSFNHHKPETDEDILADNPRVCRILKNAIDLKVCSYAEKGYGFWGDLWKCKRKVSSSSRCEEYATGKRKVKKFLKERFNLSDEQVLNKIKALRDAGLIVTYKCGRVFFNDQ